MTKTPYELHKQHCDECLPTDAQGEDELRDWRCKVFVPMTVNYDNPKLGLEHKVAIFTSVIAPEPKTSNEFKKREEEMERFTKALQAEISKQRQQAQQELLDELEDVKVLYLTEAWKPIEEFLEAKRLNLTKGGE